MIAVAIEVQRSLVDRGHSEALQLSYPLTLSLPRGALPLNQGLGAARTVILLLLLLLILILILILIGVETWGLRLRA